jgi:hypothetical protein
MPATSGEGAAAEDGLAGFHGWRERPSLEARQARASRLMHSDCSVWEMQVSDVVKA